MSEVKTSTSNYDNSLTRNTRVFSEECPRQGFCDRNHERMPIKHNRLQYSLTSPNQRGFYTLVTN